MQENVLRCANSPLMLGSIFIRRIVVLDEWIHHRDRSIHVCTIFSSSSVPFLSLSLSISVFALSSSHKIFSLMIDSLFRSPTTQGATCRLMLLGFSRSFPVSFSPARLFCSSSPPAACIPSSYHAILEYLLCLSKQNEEKKKKHNPSYFALVTVSISLAVRKFDYSSMCVCVCGFLSLVFSLLLFLMTGEDEKINFLFLFFFRFYYIRTYIYI